jgi:hypothetical protein
MKVKLLKVIQVHVQEGGLTLMVLVQKQLEQERQTVV